MTKRLPQLADINDCTGCMACVDSCNKSAIKSYRGEDGHLYVHVEQKLCVGCLQCEKICQGREKLRGNNGLKLSQPYASWTLDNKLRSKSTSGGVFAAIAKKIILEGGVVVGASFDGRYAKHIVIDSVDELINLQGSKYVHSNAEGIYREIKKYLPYRKVLFSGVGCQATAALSYFSNHPNKNNLYTIDLICGGVPSDLLMQAYREDNPQIEALTSFRTKRKYELRGIIDGREEVLPSNSLPLAGFRAEQTIRYSCYNCPFTFAHRASDITIGDLWGENVPEEECNKGVSLAIVHTEKGRILMQATNVTSIELVWKNILYANKRLVYGHTPISCLRRNLVRNYLKKDSSEFCRLYTLTSTPKHPLEFATRVWVYLLNKLNKQRSQKYVKRLIRKNY